MLQFSIFLTLLDLLTTDYLPPLILYFLLFGICKVKSKVGVTMLKSFTPSEPLFL